MKIILIQILLENKLNRMKKIRVSQLLKAGLHGFFYTNNLIRYLYLKLSL
ncbi:hypothetical protein CM318V1_460012 [Carnobacterium maltaromaticum]|nr:conserved hypothetical protein [Carnobacterium maltaromaticum]CRH19405.1 hypothetical protein CM318V1_460012 [Carnobacterium maltaromaticum]